MRYRSFSSSRVVTLFLACALVATTLASSASATSSVTAQQWSIAAEAPGSATLNAGGNAGFDSISCTDGGNCSAVGTYTDSTDHVQLMYDEEKNGTWGTAAEIPDTDLINHNAIATSNLTDSISCSSVGNCGVTGSYADASGNLHPFLENEVNGVWGETDSVTGGLIQGEGTSISCPSDGNCVAGGYYENTAGTPYAYIDTEVNGVWQGKAVLTAADSTFDQLDSLTTAISCWSTGNCVATGVSGLITDHVIGFVDTEKDGVWVGASSIAGLNSLGTGTESIPEALYCSMSGSCVLAGTYATSATSSLPFETSEVGGAWTAPQEISVVPALPSESNALVSAVSCDPTFSCVIGGAIVNSDGYPTQFLSVENNGSWSGVYGAPALLDGSDASGGSIVTGISCGLIDMCVIGGEYFGATHNGHAFEESTLGIPVTLTVADDLNVGGDADSQAVSCAPDGSCGIGGWYEDSSNHYQAFVESSSPIETSPAAPTVSLNALKNGNLTFSFKAGPNYNDGGTPLTGYEYSLNGGAWIAYATTSITASHTIHGLKKGKSYKVRLRVENNLGWSPPSPAKSIKIK